MNSTRIVDLIVYGLMALALIAGIVWFVSREHHLWALGFFVALLFLAPDYRPKSGSDKENDL